MATSFLITRLGKLSARVDINLGTPQRGRFGTLRLAPAFGRFQKGSWFEGGPLTDNHFDCLTGRLQIHTLALGTDTRVKFACTEPIDSKETVYIVGIKGYAMDMWMTMVVLDHFVQGVRCPCRLPGPVFRGEKD